jgi:periplasmic protein TonB
MGFTISERRGRLTGAGPFSAALLASLTLHGIALALLAAMSVRLPQPTAPIRVTLINPAPPPPPAGAAVAAPAPVAVAQAEPRPRQEKVIHRRERLRIKRTHRPVRETKSAVPSVAAPQNETVAKELGEPGGVKGGVLGGVLGGQVGGIVGGHGDQLWRADQVATPPVVISRPLPQYPPLARARGIEGLVVLEAVVNRQGQVEQDGLKVLQSIPALDDAAIVAFRHWRFRPARDRNGEPVRVVLRIPIRFRLR